MIRPPAPVQIGLKIDLTTIVSYPYCVLMQKYKVGGMQEFKASS